MKKILLTAAILSIALTGIAQKVNIRSAENYIRDEEFDKAKKAIEAAVADPSTKDDPRAWYVMGNLYLTMQQKNDLEAQAKSLKGKPGENAVSTSLPLYDEALKAYKKAAELKPDYEKEDMNNKLYAISIYHFNEALIAFDKGKKENYSTAFRHFTAVTDIYNMGGGRRYAGMKWEKKYDTIAHQSTLYQGFSAYYAEDYDAALISLTKAKTDPIVVNENVYLMLADIYELKNDNANFAAIVNEGRKAYPKNKSMVNKELNYYIKAGKSEELIKKLEEALQLDPKSKDLLFNLGIALDNIANPKDKDGNDLPKPANYSEVFGRAETAYMNALKEYPAAVDINYNIGALYFNRAVLVNEQMNKIEGTSAAELKQYDALKAEREQWFGKAVPFLEKTFDQLDVNPSALSGEDKNTYMSSIIALKEIYAKQNKLDKATELKKKLEAIQKK